MPILTVRHLTRYRYRKKVTFGEHRMMFRPRESYDQRLLESDIIITPTPSALRYVHDVFGNCVGIARFDGVVADELSFESRIRLEHLPDAGDYSAETEAYARIFPFAYGAEELPDLQRSIERAYPDPDHAVERWARRFLNKYGHTDTHRMLATMTAAVREDIEYATRTERGIQTPAETLQIRRGTCRDFAVLMMEALRALGLAARFVSGYIYSPGEDDAEERHRGGGHTHAWVRVYLPGCGWIEFDPTNGIVGNRDLIRVAVTRDPNQALPLSGTWNGLPSSFLDMDVEVDVDEWTATPGLSAKSRQVTGGR
ncbi:transglutaminase family protein [Roseiterribacter gracilis]|uniref:Transglutaminase n=1 Tax=Roseiterribacter gracilis TaxID=2812848 RepID=A0A8S8XA11_9PROT|nr:transglutaminase [Rhodospirillales bacterium TMPK1]